MSTYSQWIGLALLAGALVLPSCMGNDGAGARQDAAPEAMAQATQETPAQMRPEEARTFLAAHPEALILDVRNPEEWDDTLGHIEGARQIPLPDLPSRVGEIEAWKDRPVLAVCRSGRRSAIARQQLMQAGFGQVINLDGGMLAWRGKE